MKVGCLDHGRLAPDQLRILERFIQGAGFQTVSNGALVICFSPPVMNRRGVTSPVQSFLWPSACLCPETLVGGLLR